MKKRLLLADDSVTIQKVVQITFSHDDYELTVVDNGDAAYEKARSLRPDLVLADVFMPGKNGYELCAAIKNDPNLALVPVLLLTGTFEPFDEAKAKSVGADRWIAKPFESQTLIACVEELLRQSVAEAPATQIISSLPPASVSAPAPVEEAPAPVEKDIWGDDFVSLPTASDTPLVDAFAATAQDDLWDVGGFDTEPQSASAVASDDIWGSFDGEASLVGGETLAPVATNNAEMADVWGADDSFEMTSTESTATIALEAGEVEVSPLVDVEIIEDVDLVENIQELSQGAPAATPFSGNDFDFDVQSESFAEAESTIMAPRPVFPVAEPVAMSPTPSPEPSPTITPIAPSGGQAQMDALSTAQLEQIVEKVAGEVISRLAGTILEKIAWEVVPDLAETMIKEELRRIRDEVAAG